MSAFKFLGNLFNLRNVSKACARGQATKELDGCFKPENLSLFGERKVGGYHTPYLASADTTIDTARSGMGHRQCKR